MALCAGLFESLLESCITLGFFHPNYFCSKLLVQQEVGAGLGRGFADQYKRAAESEFCRRRSRLAAVVGLQGARSDEGICSLSLCFGHQEFQFAGLVPTESQAGLVVALDQQMRAVQRLFQPRHAFDGSRQMSKANRTMDIIFSPRSHTKKHEVLGSTLPSKEQIASIPTGVTAKIYDHSPL